MEWRPECGEDVNRGTKMLTEALRTTLNRKALGRGQIPNI
jgi:hypothetical protein